MTNRRIRICLKELLQKSDITQAELSRLSGVREEVISKLVHNKYERLQLSHICSIMCSLGIDSFDELLRIVDVEECEEEEES